MRGRADIEGSKSDVAMNAWPPQASYPCGNFSDTPNKTFLCNLEFGLYNVASTLNYKEYSKTIRDH